MLLAGHNSSADRPLRSPVGGGTVRRAIAMRGGVGSSAAHAPAVNDKKMSALELPGISAGIVHALELLDIILMVMSFTRGRRRLSRWRDWPGDPERLSRTRHRCLLPLDASGRSTGRYARVSSASFRCRRQCLRNVVPSSALEKSARRLANFLPPNRN